MAFERVTELYVGNFANGNSPEKKGTLVSDLDMQFHVERSTIWFENKAVFRIYNAAPTTINTVLSEGNSVIFRAGYADDAVGNIFIGQIGYAFTERKEKGIITNIICTCGRGGQYPLARVRAGMSFAKGTKVEKVIQDIAAFSGLAFTGARNIAYDDLVLDTPFVHEGDIRSTLRMLQNRWLAEYGISLFVDNNQIIMFRNGGEKSELDHVFLTSETGLIYATPYRNEGKNQINYRQDLGYWSGLRENFDTVALAQEAVKEAQKKYLDASEDGKPEALESLSKAKAALTKAQERAQTIKSTGLEPEDSEEIARQHTIKFKSILNPGIMPNTVITVKSSDPFSANGDFLVTKAVFDGDNMGGNFSTEGEASE